MCPMRIWEEIVIMFVSFHDFCFIMKYVSAEDMFSNSVKNIQFRISGSDTLIDVEYNF